jgi:hypothetical protein
MADGDEKIDHNDRVLVLNRVSDAPTSVMFNGVMVTWGPGKARSIQRDEAAHYIAKSTLRADPMATYFPAQRLAIVDESGNPLEPGASAAPLTEAECRELAKYGTTDTTNLPPDRLIGGVLLQDPETGEYPTGRVLKGNPYGKDVSAPPRAFAPKVSDQDLDVLHP